MLIWGFHPVREALRHRPHEIEHVVVGTRRGGPRRREVEELCRRHGVQLRLADEAEFGAPEAVHNGFGAAVKAAAGRRQQDAGASQADDNLVVLVEDVQDPRNLGALLRVCEGVGCGRVLVRDRGSAPLSPTAVKAAAGANEWLAVERVTNSVQELERLKADGFWVYGADAAGEAPWNVDLTGKLVLCFGGEEKGLRQLTRRHCDRLIGLPMRGRVASLNLSTAAAAILYEALRQRAAGALLESARSGSGAPAGIAQR